MSTFGRTVLATGGRILRAAADAMIRRKAGGWTIDWTPIAAVAGAPVTLSDGTVVAIGDKYIRYGTVMCKVTGAGQGNTVGKYCPYLSTATDGRQTLTRGSCFICNETVVQSQPRSDHAGEPFDGGKVWLARLTDIAANPTQTNMETAFPMVVWVTET